MATSGLRRLRPGARAFAAILQVTCTDEDAVGAVLSTFEKLLQAVTFATTKNRKAMTIAPPPYKISEKRYPVEEWLEFEQHTDVRHEYIEAHPVNIYARVQMTNDPVEK